MGHNPEFNSAPINFESEIDFKELFGVLWARRMVIVLATCASLAVSSIASLLMTDIYTAEITLAPANSDQTADGALGQLGGAASLLGVTAGTVASDEISTALAILQSRQFIGEFIKENQLLVPLFASQWNKRERVSEVDTSIYDPSTGEWLRDGGEPTELEAFRRFQQILGNPVRAAGVITLSAEWHNPEEAATWLNMLVRALNSKIRATDIEEANSAINYLRSQLESTALVEMQRVFYQLIESQTRITMLADVREEYVFRVIDPAVIPDGSSEPNRILIVVVGTTIGFLVALFSVLGWEFYQGRYSRMRSSIS